MSRRRIPIFLLIVSMVLGSLGIGTPVFATQHPTQKQTQNTQAQSAGYINPNRVAYLWSVSHSAREFLSYMDGIYDREGGYLSGQTSQGETIIVPAPAIAWSGSLWMKPGAIPLWVDSDYVGVYYVETPVDLQGGRYFRLTRYMDPCQELLDWGTCDGIPKWVPGSSAQPTTASTQPGATQATTSDVPQLQAVMSRDQFKTLWQNTDPKSPEPLIQQLNKAFDEGFAPPGGQGKGILVPAGSIMWTNLDGKLPTLADTGQPASADKLVCLRTLGGQTGFGVFGVYHDLKLHPDVGARYVTLAPMVDPGRDLPGWNPGC